MRYIIYLKLYVERLITTGTILKAFTTNNIKSHFSFIGVSYNGLSEFSSSIPLRQSASRVNKYKMSVCCREAWRFIWLLSLVFAFDIGLYVAQAGLKLSSR